MTRSPDVPDFRDALREAERKDMCGVTSRTFFPLSLGDTLLSIQASEAHSCQPRTTLDDPYQYHTWEVALLDADTRASLTSKERAVRLPLEYHGAWMGRDLSVASYVPTNNVQMLFEWFWFRAQGRDADTDDALIGFEDPTYITTDE